MRFSRPSLAHGFARNAGESAYPSLWQDLEGCWDFSLGPQGQTPRDYSGKGRHGSMTGGFGSDLVWEITPFGWGLRSNAAAGTSRVTIPSLTTGPVFTWAARIKWTTFTESWEALFSQGAAVGIFSRASQLIRLETAGTGIYNNTTLNTGQWYIMVLVIDGTSTAKWYIDAKEDASGAVTSQSFNADSMFNDPSSETFDGVIAWQMLWKRPLSVAEIQLLQQGGTPLTLKGRVIGKAPSAGGTTLFPSGIASSEAFGTPSVQLQVNPTGIATSEAFGTQHVKLQINTNGIASQEAFGTFSIGAAIGPSGIASQEAFGTPHFQLRINMNGIASLEAFGFHQVGTATTSIMGGRSKQDMKMAVNKPSSTLKM